MKKDKLMKKKFPDYKVAYVTLVCTCNLATSL